jgi:diaminopimelate decarboxylase
VTKPWTSAHGVLTIGDTDVSRLAERVGSTPYFAYDRNRITQRLEAVRAALSDRISLSYAVKANPMPAVVQHLASLVDAFDVASALEMNTALDTGMGASRISFAGPGKTDPELSRAVAAEITIEIESRTEAHRVIAAGERLGVRPRIAVRVNPDFQVKGSGMRMGGGSQQFGVDAEAVPALLAELDDAIEVVGFHVFAGSQNLNTDILCEAQTRTVELVLRLAEAARQPVRYLNLGGGFGIPYFPKDTPLDLSRIGDHLQQLVADRIDTVLPGVRVTIELGRYLVGESGIYVTRIVDRKESRGRTFLVVDGGLHHQLAASGNFGQVIRKNYPVAIATHLDTAPSEQVTVVGCLCTPLDLLADDVELPRADVGDLVVIFQSGAYGLTASPTAFLGHPPPTEVLV